MIAVMSLKTCKSYPRAQTLNYASLAAILISAVLTVWMFIMITQIKLIRFMLLSTNLPLTGISGIPISAKTIFSLPTKEFTLIRLNGNE